jgi:hypothetical protein
MNKRQAPSSPFNVAAGREPRLDVVLCCIPHEVIDACTDQKRRPEAPKANESTLRGQHRNQLALFEASLGTEGEK